jgi:predicted nucleic acid-binding protein
MILIDASGLIAALDESQPQHVAAAEALRTSGVPRLLSPFVLAELDYLLAKRVSASVARSLVDDVAARAYQLEPFDNDDVAAAIEIMDRLPGVNLGLADASIVVLAERHRVHDVLTLDERHFRVLRALGGRPFRILPADA